MPHVITRPCCNDAGCVSVCPVDCIRPRPGDPDFLTAEMLYIDPDTCIDCGACVPACPVTAIVPDEARDASHEPYLALSTAYFGGRSPSWERSPDTPLTAAPSLPAGGLSVAVVGAGPTGHFLATELLATRGVRVDVFDRLPTPGGLVRSGVAPDHPETRGVDRLFTEVSSSESFRYLLNVEVGRDVFPEELMEHYDAVVYAHGSSEGRKLDLHADGVAGVHSAAEIVGWYNGHPDYADLSPDLSHERAVVIGTGNVALDVARMLLGSADRLQSTDVAAHALSALRTSQLREVVVLGRRGVEHASYTSAELLALLQHPEIDLIVEKRDLELSDSTAVALAARTLDPVAAAKIGFVAEAARSAPRWGGRRLRLRFLTTVERLEVVDGALAAIEVRNQTFDGDALAPEDGLHRLPAGLLISATGYTVSQVPGVPWDAAAGHVPNCEGRVLGQPGGKPVPGLYVAGWAKRGTSGGIGRNRACARETAAKVLEDAGLLAARRAGGGGAKIAELLGERGVTVVDRDGWLRIDRAERAAGLEHGSPRHKFVSRKAMLDVATHE